MPEYVVLFPADSEAERAAATDAERQAVFDTDFAFGQRLETFGAAVIGGKGLEGSGAVRTLTRGPGSEAVIARGPHVTGDGQLSGFFIVTCDDYDDLVEAAEVLVQAHPVVEIRPVKTF